ncbi:hypothetical protein MXD81_09280, partial [Microbacteriaceae bacterium K1510]|nr:hypothetical protein [Microbacteriaceae bacterium K1510]
ATTGTTRRRATRTDPPAHRTAAHNYPFAPSPGRNLADGPALAPCTNVAAAKATRAMHEIIYLIGLVVVVMFILGLVGVR